MLTEYECPECQGTCKKTWIEGETRMSDDCDSCEGRGVIQSEEDDE